MKTSNDNELFNEQSLKHLRELGWSRNDQTFEKDVFMVGYPKSGNTWMQTILAGLVFGCDPQVCPDSVIQDLIPDVHDRHVYRRYLTRMIFKSHHFPQKSYRRVIYLIRDGRDVMVSYLHFINALSSEPICFDKFINGPPPFPGAWSDHVTAWESNPFDAEMIFVRYEDLLFKPEIEMEKIARFLGLELSQERLRFIADKSSFKIQREKEARIGMELELLRAGTMFNRRGKSGSFRDEMPRETREIFERQAGSTLARLGYLTEALDPAASPIPK